MVIRLSAPPSPSPVYRKTGVTPLAPVACYVQLAATGGLVIAVQNTDGPGDGSESVDTSEAVRTRQAACQAYITVTKEVFQGAAK
ncbi:hypothetical protein NHX12_032899 [Muraenolepis orangiensis]|uniref:Uncharacterized protein n=1 Tax=Muraenolepis orangiensis TaxID=630683 RepID=A0A9Q0E436_9TELE|nr:hypothetical protein NHX12_032899 [Muraenolepis orangiensis]